MLSFFIIHLDVWFIASHMQSQECLSERDQNLKDCMQLSHTKGAFQKVCTGQLNKSFKKSEKAVTKSFCLKTSNPCIIIVGID